MGFELVGVRLWGVVGYCGILWDSILVGGSCVLFVCGMNNMIRASLLVYRDILHDDILYEI